MERTMNPVNQDTGLKEWVGIHELVKLMLKNLPKWPEALKLPGEVPRSLNERIERKGFKVIMETFFANLTEDDAEKLGIPGIKNNGTWGEPHDIRTREGTVNQRKAYHDLAYTFTREDGETVEVLIQAKGVGHPNGYKYLYAGIWWGGNNNKKLYNEQDNHLYICELKTRGVLTDMWIFPTSVLVAKGLVQEKPTSQTSEHPHIHPPAGGVLLRLYKAGGDDWTAAYHRHIADAPAEAEAAPAEPAPELVPELDTEPRRSKRLAPAEPEPAEPEPAPEPAPEPPPAAAPGRKRPRKGKPRQATH